MVEQTTTVSYAPAGALSGSVGSSFRRPTQRPKPMCRVGSCWKLLSEDFKLQGVDPALLRSKIQEVTKGMVGSELDVDADMPLMDIGTLRV